MKIQVMGQRKGKSEAMAQSLKCYIAKMRPGQKILIIERGGNHSTITRNADQIEDKREL